MIKEIKEVPKEIKLHDKEFELYITSASIQARVVELAAMINEDMKGKKPLFIGVLNGAFLFCADIFKHITTECDMTFVRVSSYQGTTSSGIVKSVMGLNEMVNGRTIVFVEDIIDTGATAAFLKNEIAQFKPESVHWAALLVKNHSEKVFHDVNYKGFEVPDDYLVGYGLDYNNIGRNLNDIYKEIIK